MSGFKTYLAAAGLFGLAIYDVSQGNYNQAITHFIAGLAAVGIRHAISNMPGA